MIAMAIVIATVSSILARHRPATRATAGPIPMAFATEAVPAARNHRDFHLAGILGVITNGIRKLLSCNNANSVVSINPAIPRSNQLQDAKK